MNYFIDTRNCYLTSADAGDDHLQDQVTLFVPVDRFGLQKVIRLFILASYIKRYILDIQTCDAN